MKFSAYTRREAALVSIVARWLPGARLFRGAFDPHAASCELRVGGLAIDVRGAASVVRAAAQRLLGGPPELAAPRPLGAVERAVWAAVVAQELPRLGIDGMVWPCLDDAPPGGIPIELPGLAAVAYVPHEVERCTPPVRPLPSWDVLVRHVVARCALPPAGVDRLALRDIVIVERCDEVEIVGASGYVPPPMALSDDAPVELTVTLPPTRRPLREVVGLTEGQIIPLGRPLAGPFEVHALGRRLGRGELVDVDGELGVRIVSLGD